MSTEQKLLTSAKFDPQKNLLVLLPDFYFFKPHRNSEKPDECPLLTLHASCPHTHTQEGPSPWDSSVNKPKEEKVPFIIPFYPSISHLFVYSSFVHSSTLILTCVCCISAPAFIFRVWSELNSQTSADCIIKKNSHTQRKFSDHRCLMAVYVRESNRWRTLKGRTKNKDRFGPRWIFPKTTVSLSVCRWQVYRCRLWRRDSWPDGPSDRAAKGYTQRALQGFRYDLSALFFKYFEHKIQ